MVVRNLHSMFSLCIIALLTISCAARKKTTVATTAAHTENAVALKDTVLPDLPKIQNEQNMKLTVLDTAVSTQLIWLDFESGFAKAAKEKKILLVDVYTNWCGWCKVMDQKTYSQPSVIEKINSHFVPVKLNPEVARTYRFADTSLAADELHKWMGNGKTYGFPAAYFILKPDMGFETIIQVGYLEEKDFLDILNQVIAKKK